MTLVIYIRARRLGAASWAGDAPPVRQERAGAGAFLMRASSSADTLSTGPSPGARKRQSSHGVKCPT